MSLLDPWKGKQRHGICASCSYAKWTTPTSLNAGRQHAKSIATASSWPGSQSSQIGISVAVILINSS